MAKPGSGRHPPIESMARPIPATEYTLIGRLQDPADTDAWSKFVDRYRLILFQWCRRWNLSEVDSEDVTQNILLELSQHIRKYQPTGRFRGWLKTVARRAWYDFTQRAQVLDRAVGGDDYRSFLNSTVALDDLTTSLEREAARELIEVAKVRVKSRVSKSSWEAFALMTFEEIPGDQVALKLGMTLGSVYVVTCRVKKQFQIEVRQIMHGFDCSESSSDE